MAKNLGDLAEDLATFFEQYRDERKQKQDIGRNADSPIFKAAEFVSMFIRIFCRHNVPQTFMPDSMRYVSSGTANGGDTKFEPSGLR